MHKIWQRIGQLLIVMYNPDTELLFPLRVIPELASLRGPEWSELVERVSSKEAEQLDKLAFVLLMVGLGGCVTCNADSYRARQGCTQCAQRAVRRFHESDQELLEMYNQCHTRIKYYLQVEYKSSQNTKVLDFYRLLDFIGSQSIIAGF